MILYMYIAPGLGQTGPGDEVLMSTGLSCHFIHLLQVLKKMSLKSDFIIFFHDLIHVYSPGAEADSLGQPLGDKLLMSTERPHYFIHLLQVS